MKKTSPIKKTRVASAHVNKYMQLAHFISQQIEQGKLNINDRLPSLNALIKHLNMSKETVLKGLNYLIEKGVIESVYRKGYYVRKRNPFHHYRICIVFDKMNVLRDRIYQSFFEEIKDFAEVDIFFHHHNVKVFQKLIEENLNSYTHFVITTFFREDVSDILNTIPPQKRVILDYNVKGLDGNYTCIYQDFEADVYDALNHLKKRLLRYKKLILIIPNEAFHAPLLISGFKKYCIENKFKYVVARSVADIEFEQGNAFITLNKYDLDDVAIIGLCRANNWELGKDIGLLSYNDTAVKEILENGITVITTDFNKMGTEAAKAILKQQSVVMRDYAKVIVRNSL